MATLPPRRQRRRQYQDMERTILSLARLRYTPPEIHEQLIAKLGHASAPSLRTVQRIVRDLDLPEEAGQPWTLGNSSEDEAKVAVEALVWLGPYSLAEHGRMGRERGGRAGFFEQRYIAWLARMRAAVPGLPLHVAHVLASEYSWREARDADAEDLDLALAYAPRGPETPVEFLIRVVTHAKVHCEIWPDRVFYVTAFEPIASNVAAQVQVALVGLPGDSLLMYLPEPVRSWDFQQQIDAGITELRHLQSQWEDQWSRMKPFERGIGPDTKWWAVDQYITRYVERELGKDLEEGAEQ
jgi:hypothetical protein